MHPPIDRFAVVLLTAALLVPHPGDAQSAASAAGTSSVIRRPLRVDDFLRLRDVRDVQRSPDGEWVAYVVSAPDTTKDRYQSDVWMVSWDGARTVRLTTSPESENTPRWSPDGRWLAFLSGRQNDEGEAQLWLLDRRGGEAEQVTSVKGDIEDYAWSPDGTRLALVVTEPDSAERDTTKKKAPKPIVVDRFQFKEDITGYLGKSRSHLHLFDLATRKTEPLTSGAYNEQLPAWSPDGTRIAFTSKRGADMDRSDDWNLYVMDARPGAPPRQLTTFEGPDASPDFGSAPAWSPDGRAIAYVQGGVPKLIYYAGQKLAVVAVDGSAPPRLLTAALDRNATQPLWTRDGKTIWFTLEDDRAVQLARVPAAGGPVERVVTGRLRVSEFSLGADGHAAVVVATALSPNEIYAVDDGGTLRRLSHHNDRWLDSIALGSAERIDFKSKDGTPIGGFLVTPPGWTPGRRLPAILRIHGGPVSQFEEAFDFTLQLLAANGYAVIVANPRGSSGRGEKFSTAIYADWGNKDAQDVLAAVDHAVARGIADPARLGVGGWSYGGILTNYVLVQDRRFKAAVSGASIANVLAGYGTDQYIREYEAELGTPWSSPKVWLNLSRPFLQADRIVTPTLWMCGEKDFNVPLLNSEQMYQAMRSLGRETQLVIYPGQYHDIRRPSYRIDRLERYLAWYDRFLKPDLQALRNGN